MAGIAKTIRSRSEAQKFIATLKELDKTEVRPNIVHVYWHFWKIIGIDTVSEDGAITKIALEQKLTVDKASVLG